MPNEIITRAIDAVASGEHLTADHAATVLAEIMAGRSSDVQTGAFLIAREAARHLRRGGNLILVDSQASLKGGRLWGAYSASKGGVLRLADSLVEELAPQGVRVPHALRLLAFSRTRMRARRRVPQGARQSGSSRRGSEGRRRDALTKTRHVFRRT